MSGDENYDIAETRRSVDELYPVLLDAHGNLIDGNSRLDAVPGWRTETRENIRTRSQLWLARIVANSCRRVVTREERATQLTELAKCLAEEGVERGDMVSTVAGLTTFSERYVRELLPEEYKREYKAPGKSELSSELENSAKSEELGEALEPTKSAPSSEFEDQANREEFAEALEALGITVPTVSRPQADAAVAHDADTQSGTPEPVTQVERGAPGPAGEPREAALDHIRRFLDEHPEPDEEYLAWELAIRHGVPTKEGRELIGRVKRERGIEEEPREASPDVTCPLCSRGGASREMILGRVRDPSLGQLTLLEFVLGEMG